MQKQRIELKDVPEGATVHGHIWRTLNMAQYQTMPKQHDPETFFEYKIPGLDTDAVLKAVKEADQIHGWYGFLSHFSDAVANQENRSPYYGGFSITSNPTIAYPVPEHASALGEPKTNLHDFFDDDFGREIWFKLEDKKLTPEFYKICFESGLIAAKDFLLEHGVINGTEIYNWDKPFNPTKRIQKNGYFDTYSFRNLTPGANHGALGEFLRDQMSIRMCRSRTAYINGMNYHPKIAEYMWHYDEPVTINLRINIPLQTTDSYVAEIKDKGIHKFKVGYGYSWNTEVIHRVYATQQEPTSRIHLVLGTIPWFDYDAESNSYITNEYFGELHPFDMLATGKVIKGVSF
jgi:hypothetical protein